MRDVIQRLLGPTPGHVEELGLRCSCTSYRTYPGVSREGREEG